MNLGKLSDVQLSVKLCLFITRKKLTILEIHENTIAD